MSKYLPRAPRCLALTLTAGFLLLTILTAAPAQAEDAPPGGFPSWSDVAKAKGDAAATSSEVARISALLDVLDLKAAELGTTAVKAGADLALIQRNLDAATAEVAILSEQTRRAEADAAKHKQDAVAVAVHSYKTGGGGLGLVATLSALESADSLNGIDLMRQVGEQAAIKQHRAVESQAAAEALEATREAALAAQRQLGAAAQQSADAAVAAQAAVVQQFDAKKTQSTTLVALLAALKNTSAAKEQEYRDGQDALAAYAMAQSAKREAAAQARQNAVGGKPALFASKPDSNPGIKEPAPRPAKPAPAKPAPPVPAVPARPAPPVPAKPAPADPNPHPGYIPVDVLLPNIPGGAVNDPAGAKAYASSRLSSYGWAAGQFPCLVQLWERESNWRTNATNPYSGAYGIAQSLPPSKYASAGPDWLSNYRTQVNWGLGYIKNRYGSPCGAWAHSQSVGWY